MEKNLRAPSKPLGRRLPWPFFRRGAKLVEDEGGASAVEFAFVLPLLLLLFTGMIDVGVLMMTQNNLMRVAQNAARNLSLAEMNKLETEAYVRDKLSNLGPTLDVQATLPDTTTTPPQTDVVVTVSIPMADVIPIDVIGMEKLDVFQSGTLSTQVVMRQEVPQAP